MVLGQVEGQGQSCWGLRLVHYWQVDQSYLQLGGEYLRQNPRDAFHLRLLREQDEWLQWQMGRNQIHWLRWRRKK